MQGQIETAELLLEHLLPGLFSRREIGDQGLISLVDNLILSGLLRRRLRGCFLGVRRLTLRGLGSDQDEGETEQGKQVLHGGVCQCNQLTQNLQAVTAALPYWTTPLIGWPVTAFQAIS